VSERDGLFRDEAIAFIRHRRGPGELVQASADRTERAYRLLLALVAAGVIASLVVRVGDDPLLYVLLPALETLIERVPR
jgi:hypothetical protein